MSLVDLVGVQSELPMAEQQIVLDTLKSILDSAHFSKSPRSRALLEFAIRNALHGNSGSLKERSVGIEVFGRSADYDTSSDPIVRTAAVEVRRRIVQYFSEHPESPIRIELPPGSYKATIHFRTQPADRNSLPDQEAQGLLDASPAYQQPAITQVWRSQENSSLTAPKPKGVSYWWKTRGVPAIAAVLILSLAALGWWRHQRNDGFKQFWGPVLQSGGQPLILIGRTNFSGATNAANGLSAPASVSDQFPSLVLDDAIAAAQVCATFRQYGRECKIEPVQTAGGEEMGNRSIVVIGGLGSPWTQQILTPLLYYPQLASPAQPKGAVAIMKRQSTGDIPLWTYNRFEPPAQFDKDYAIVARFRNTITGGMTVVVAGLGFRGTSSAGQFVSSPEQLHELFARAPKGWSGTNFEAVLQVDLVQGTSSRAEVIASNFW